MALRTVLLLAAGLSLAADEKPPTDRHGDVLPPGAVARLGTARFQHGGSVGAVAFLPDGKTLASADQDGRVYLWEASNGKLLLQTQERKTGRTTCLAVSPDGKRLATGYASGEAYLWETATGRLLVRLALAQGAEVPEVNGLSFSPDSKVLATGDNLGWLRLWEATSGKELPGGGKQPEPITGLTYTGKEKELIAAGLGQTVRLWDTSSGKEVRRFRVGSRVEGRLAISPDGATFAVGCDGAFIRLWDTATGKERLRFAAADSLIECLVFSPDARTLASGGASLALWDIGTGKQLRTWGTGPLCGASSVAFSPDGKVLVSAHYDWRVHLWDTATGKELQAREGHIAPIRDLACSADGKQIATGADDAVWLWAPDGRPLRRFSKGSHFSAVAFSPDGKLLAAGGQHRRGISIWETETGKEAQEVVLEDVPFGAGLAWRGCSSLAFSPDGKWLASGHRNTNSLSLWDRKGQGPPRELIGHTGPVETVAFAADGMTLASGGRDTKVRLWDPVTGKQRACFEGHENWVGAVVFSPDGRLLASAVHDSGVRIWDIATGREMQMLKGASGTLPCVAFSPDGRMLAWNGSDNTIRLWEVATGAVRRRLPGRAHGTLAFGPRGSTLAAAEADGTGLVWDVFASLAPTPADPERWYADLADPDADLAFKAICALIATPDAGARLLSKRLLPVQHADSAKVRRLIAALDGDDFDEREKATRQLTELGESALGLLRRTLEQKPSAEAKQRIGQVLREVEAHRLSAEARQIDRATEALEQMASPAAKQVLRTLAEGAPEAQRTIQAKAALARLEKP
jgi:WD40 repeat protein